MIQTLHWCDQTNCGCFSASAGGYMCPGPAPASKHRPQLTVLLTQIRHRGPHRHRIWFICGSCHAQEEGGCEGLGRCHTTGMWSSAPTWLKSNQTGLFSSAAGGRRRLSFIDCNENTFLHGSEWLRSLPKKVLGWFWLLTAFCGLWPIRAGHLGCDGNSSSTTVFTLRNFFNLIRGD